MRLAVNRYFLPFGVSRPAPAARLDLAAASGDQVCSRLVGVRAESIGSPEHGDTSGQTTFPAWPSRANGQRLVTGMAGAGLTAKVWSDATAPQLTAGELAEPTGAERLAPGRVEPKTRAVKWQASPSARDAAASVAPAPRLGVM